MSVYTVDAVIQSGRYNRNISCQGKVEYNIPLLRHTTVESQSSVEALLEGEARGSVTPVHFFPCAPFSAIYLEN